MDVKEVERKEPFFEFKVDELLARVKSLEWDNAELVKTNEELSDRVTKLANKQPSWPKGYRPQNRRHNIR